jgi:hypothetical protein
MQYIFTDAGAIASGANERDDCTVRSLAIAAVVPYATAWQIAATAGRRAGRAFSIDRLMQKAKEVLGLNFNKINFLPPLQIEDFIAQYPNGRYILCTKWHTCVVVDSIVYDSSEKSMSAITSVYEMLPLS